MVLTSHGGGATSGTNMGSASGPKFSFSFTKTESRAPDFALRFVAAKRRAKHELILDMQQREK